MPKIVVIANSQDGPTNWDEVEIRQLHKGNEPDVRFNHHRRRDNFNKEELPAAKRNMPVRPRQNMRSVVQDTFRKLI